MNSNVPTLIALLSVVGATTPFLSSAEGQTLDYPKTTKTDHIDTYFGTKIADPYHWLEDDRSVETKVWVEAQNKVTFDYLTKIPYRNAILDRLKTLVNYPRYTVPSNKNGLLYYSKNSGLQNQSVLFVQPGEAGTAEVLLDPNTFSADGTIRLSLFSVSKDGNYAVYGKTAIPGSDWQNFYVMEMNTRKTLDEVLHWAKFSSVAWRGNGFYYSRFPEPPKGEELTVRAVNQKVYYHKVGTPQSEDTLVYEDPANPERYVSVDTTEDERFAFLYLSDQKKRGNSLAFRDESKGETAFTPLVKEISEDSFGVIKNVVEGEKSKFLIQTNRNAPNQKVMLCDPQNPDETHWQTVIPEKPEPLSGISAAGGKLFVSYLKDVSTHTYVYSTDGKLENEIKFPAPGSASGFSGHREDKVVYYSFTTFNYPPTVFRYEIATHKTSVFRAPEIPHFSSSDYESKQVFYKSKDGTRIPMFLVYKKGLKHDGKNPTLLYGYGGFNVSLDPYFSAINIAWLEQGGIYAQMNLRGGSEYGEKWHEAGMRLNKQNVFDDCIAAAEYLIHEKYTSPEHLALQGGSNGGLLVGAVINQRPDLFRVALPAVGVMDMLRFQKFTAGVGWVSDYGSSDDETQFKYLLGYSPLHNIKAGAKYPAVLVSTSDHDDRVVPAHSFKYTATLQEKAGGTNPYLIRIETNSGHGSSNLTKALEETADTYAFIWQNMGITPKY